MIKTQFKKSGEIHLKAKTGPLGALGDGTAKVVNQVYLNNTALVKMCLTHVSQSLTRVSISKNLEKK